MGGLEVGAPPHRRRRKGDALASNECNPRDSTRLLHVYKNLLLPAHVGMHYCAIACAVVQCYTTIQERQRSPAKADISNVVLVLVLALY